MYGGQVAKQLSFLMDCAIKTALSLCVCIRQTDIIRAYMRRDSYGDNTSFIERWGAGVETKKNVRGEIGGWGRVPFNETYAPLLSTIYDGA